MDVPAVPRRRTAVRPAHRPRALPLPFGSVSAVFRRTGRGARPHGPSSSPRDLCPARLFGGNVSKQILGVLSCCLPGILCPGLGAALFRVSAWCQRVGSAVGLVIGASPLFCDPVHCVKSQVCRKIAGQALGIPGLWGPDPGHVCTAVRVGCARATGEQTLAAAARGCGGAPVRGPPGLNAVSGRLRGH